MKEAKRNAMIFVGLLSGEIIVLIVTMILKHRNEYYEEDYSDTQEFTEDGQSVENGIQEESIKDEIDPKEIRRARREKRKGKHC